MTDHLSTAHEHLERLKWQVELEHVRLARTGRVHLLVVEATAPEGRPAAWSDAGEPLRRTIMRPDEYLEAVNEIRRSAARGLQENRTACGREIDREWPMTTGTPFCRSCEWLLEAIETQRRGAAERAVEIAWDAELRRIDQQRQDAELQLIKQALDELRTTG